MKLPSLHLGNFYHVLLTSLNSQKHAVTNTNWCNTSLVWQRCKPKKVARYIVAKGACYMLQSTRNLYRAVPLRDKLQETFHRVILAKIVNIESKKKASGAALGLHQNCSQFLLIFKTYLCSNLHIGNHWEPLNVLSWLIGD